MTSDTRSPDEIEREIERERSELSHTLDDLRDKFSVDSIARQFSAQFREHGGDIGRSVADAVKRNPVALALTGVGLAWLMMGDGPGFRHGNDRRYGRVDHDEHSDYDRVASAGRAGGNVSHMPRPQERPLGSATGDPRPYRAGQSPGADHVPSWARPGERDDDNQPGATSRLRDSANRTKDSVSDAARATGTKVSDNVKDASGAVSQAGRSTMEGARNLASTASSKAGAFRERLAEGTENLSEEARNRVIAARERAIEARDAAMAYGRRGRDRAADLYEEQPLIAGALALAIGAAIGAALPRSRAEDQYFGDYSDNLIHEAERIYEEEKAKLSRVAGAATDEAKKIAEETKQAADDAAPADTAAEAALDKAKSSGQRIADAAEDEAKRQKLGEVKKS